MSVWDYTHANPPRKELNIETSEILLATVQCDHDENNPYVVPKAEAEANAKLFAAAPQLLAALQRYHRWHSGVSDEIDTTQMAEQASAAIAIATGGAA